MPQPQSDELANFDGETLGERFPQEVSEDSTDESQTSEAETTSDETKGSESSEETSAEESHDKDTDEERGVENGKEPVPRYRFEKVYQERNELRSRIAALERRSPDSLSDDDKFQLDEDKKLESKLDSLLVKREQSKRQQQESDTADLVDLMDVYGNFDVDKVLTVKDEYHISDNLAAVKLYFKIYGTGKTPKGDSPAPKGGKPKVPKPKGSAPAGTSDKKVDIKSQSLTQLVEEGLKEHGVTR